MREVQTQPHFSILQNSEKNPEIQRITYRNTKIQRQNTEVKRMKFINTEQREKYKKTKAKYRKTEDKIQKDRGRITERHRTKIQKYRGTFH